MYVYLLLLSWFSLSLVAVMCHLQNHDATYFISLDCLDKCEVGA